MSQWTQVSGSIRIDAFTLTPEEEKRIEVTISENLGKSIHFSSPREDWNLPKAQRTPTGSEGGIHYQYIPNNDDEESSSINKGTILMQGSLRDYGGSEDGYFKDNTPYTEIIDWLNRALGGDLDGIWIRQGAIEIVVEGAGKHIIVYYDGESESFKEVLLKESKE